MPAIVFAYRPIVTNTTIEPLAASIERGGEPIDLTDYTATVTIRGITDEILVNAAPATINGDRAEYALPPELVAAITIDGDWLVEWRFTAPNGLVLRTLVARLPVRARL